MCLVIWTVFSIGDCVMYDQPKKINLKSNENGKDKPSRDNEPPERSAIPTDRRWKA